MVVNYVYNVLQAVNIFSCFFSFEIYPKQFKIIVLQ